MCFLQVGWSQLGAPLTCSYRTISEIALLLQSKWQTNTHTHTHNRTHTLAGLSRVQTSQVGASFSRDLEQLFGTNLALMLHC
jgi:hypothetical protein